MSMDANKELKFTTTHIDIARNSTDDFNLFHDKIKWSEIDGNPFNGPIVLGFQLLGLIAEKFRCYRQENNEQQLIDENSLHYSYYQLKFAGAVKPEHSIDISIKKSQFKSNPEISLGNRFTLKADNKLALIGFKKELAEPSILTEFDISSIENIPQLPDRSFIDANAIFVKHKFFNTSNGKNFLVSCLTEQSLYFDEISNIVTFPEFFPLALSSCALLERAQKLNHDFRKNPLVYVSHQHCINKRLVASLKSNMKLSILVKHEEDTKTGLITAHCFGIINHNEILFRSELCLSPLEQSP